MQRGSRTVRSQRGCWLTGNFRLTSGVGSKPRKGEAPSGSPTPSSRPRPRSHTHAPQSVSHRMRFRRPPASLLTLFSLPNTRAGHSPFDPSEAADAATGSPPSPSPPLLAGLLAGKVVCKTYIDHRGYVFPHYFFYSSFLNLDSTCCNYSTLRLNIRGRSWGQKALLIDCQILRFST